MKHQLVLIRENLDKQVLDYFKIKIKKKVNLNPWKKITKIILQYKKINKYCY